MTSGEAVVYVLGNGDVPRQSCQGIGPFRFVAHPLQGDTHFIECDCQVSDFIVSHDRHARIEFAFADRMRGGKKVP